MARTHTQAKTDQRKRRHARIRARVRGTAQRPRLAVYKSNRYLYAQLIDDDKGATLTGAATFHISGETQNERAKALGVKIAEQAKAQGIEKAVFDRGGFIYTGNIQQCAEGAREAGLVL